MSGGWSEQELQRIDDARELCITAERRDGRPGREVPIWVVTTGEQVYVRTWHRRETGWFGHAMASGRARIRVPGLDAEVEVEDVGDGSPALRADVDGSPALRADVDGAYRAKYGDGGSVDGMVTGAAVASTLRLIPTSQR